MDTTNTNKPPIKVLQKGSDRLIIIYYLSPNIVVYLSSMFAALYVPKMLCVNEFTQIFDDFRGSVQYNCAQDIIISHQYNSGENYAWGGAKNISSGKLH